MKPNVSKKDVIFEKLRDSIITGKLMPESRLPKEVDFAKKLGVGRVTLRSALERLLDEGLIERIPGKGTFVAQSSEICPRRFLAIMPPQNESFESPMRHIMPGIECRAGERSVKIQKYGVEFFRALTVDEGVERIIEGGYEGIFYMTNGVIGNERDFQIAKASGLPVVMPHASRFDYKITGFAVMNTDEKAGFGSAVKSLATKGHRQIGTIFLPGVYRKVIRGFTYNEYRDFLEENGLDNARELIKNCNYEYDEVAGAVIELMRLQDPPTAIMCYSDFVALHVYRILREMDICIPRQVAVMGYCNYPGGELLSPSLSTVDLLFEQIGRDALDLLMDSGKWWKSGITPPYVTTPFKVIERGSTNVKMLEKELVETILF